MPQQENDEEVFSRVSAWRNHVSKESSQDDQDLSDASDAPKLIEQARFNREASLRVFRKAIQAILLATTLATTERRQLLESCYKTVLEDHGGDLSFSSLLYEPLESVNLPPLVHELLNVPQDALNYSDFEVALYLIQAWDGSLISVPPFGSCDLIRTVRKTCLRRGDTDSGNSVFQSLKEHLWVRVIKSTVSKSTRNPVFPVNIFPAIPSTSPHRDALLSPADKGFLAYISLPDFPDTLRDSIRDIWGDPSQQRSQSERRNLITPPSSNSPAQRHTALLLNSSLQVDFLACGCAWVFEIGRNHLKLCLVDSDGSIDKDELLVSASVEISSCLLSARNAKESYRFTFPETLLHVPSYLRSGPSLIQIPRCFPYEPPFYSNSPLRDLSGFDDSRLYGSTTNQDLSIRLVVRLEMQRKTLVAPLCESQGNETLSTHSFVQDVNLHRRSQSVPVVRVTEPDSSISASRRTESPMDPNLHTPTSMQNIPLDFGGILAPGVNMLAQTVIDPREVPEAPTPPPSYLEATLQSISLPDILPPQNSISGHSGTRSDTHAIIHSLSNVNTFVGVAERVAVLPTINAPRPFRPLPKPPTLSIDTVNIRPSHVNTPEQVLNELPPVDALPLTPKGGNVSGPISSPLTATYRTTPCLNVPARGPSRSPQYTLPNVPPLFTTRAPDVRNSAFGNSSIETAVPSNGSGSTSLSAHLPSRTRPSSPRLSDLDSWRNTILYEIEDRFNRVLPRDRVINSGDTKLAPLYPFTVHYGYQYLAWLGSQDACSNLPNIQTHTAFMDSWQSIPILKGLANHKKVQDFVCEICQLSERHANSDDTALQWALLLRRSFKRDIDDLVRLTSGLINSEKNTLHEVIDLGSSDSSKFMDLLQTLIDRRVGVHRQFERFLQKLVHTSGQLPEYLFISGIRRIGDNPVGGGGFSDVWEGEVSGRRVALKVLRRFGLASPQHELHQDFCKESMIWRQFRHPNVLPFYGVCTDEFSPQLAMVSPWMDNGDVLSYLKRNPTTNRQTLSLGIAYGLQYLHSLKPQVIHGDLRAANVLVNHKGRPMLADFGLAKIIDSQATSVGGQSFNGKGAMRWQAPELLDSSRFNGMPCVLTTYSDIYAFSSVCLEIFTEEVPFAELRDGTVVMEVVMHDKRPPRPSEPALQRGLDDNMWKLMQDCWKSNPTERPTAGMIADVLAKGRL